MENSEITKQIAAERRNKRGEGVPDSFQNVLRDRIVQRIQNGYQPPYENAADMISRRRNRFHHLPLMLNMADMTAAELYSNGLPSESVITSDQMSECVVGSEILWKMISLENNGYTNSLVRLRDYAITGVPPCYEMDSQAIAACFSPTRRIKWLCYRWRIAWPADIISPEVELFADVLDRVMADHHDAATIPVEAMPFIARDYGWSLKWILLLPPSSPCWTRYLLSDELYDIYFKACDVTKKHMEAIVSALYERQGVL